MHMCILLRSVFFCYTLRGMSSLGGFEHGARQEPFEGWLRVKFRVSCEIQYLCVGSDHLLNRHVMCMSYSQIIYKWPQASTQQIQIAFCCFALFYKSDTNRSIHAVGKLSAAGWGAIRLHSGVLSLTSPLAAVSTRCACIVEARLTWKSIRCADQGRKQRQQSSFTL